MVSTLLFSATLSLHKPTWQHVRYVRHVRIARK